MTRQKAVIKRLATSQHPIDDPDLQLVQQVKAGDKNAFKMLVKQHKDKVRNLVYYTMGEGSMVDDLSQEVFIKIYSKIDKFRMDAKFTTWLYRVTVNHCRDALRKRKLKKLLEVFDHTHADKQWIDEPERFETAELVRLAISKLPEYLRTPLVLRDMDGFSYKEIADITGLEMGTVKSRIFRAREALKTILSPIKKDLLL